MPENLFVPLPGSERQPVAGAQPGAELDASTRIEVTLVTRRRERLPAEVVTGPETLSRDELAARHGTDPSDVALIRDVLGRFGLTVTGADAGARRVTVAGPVSAFSQAFGATLRRVSAPHPTASARAAPLPGRRPARARRTGRRRARRARPGRPSAGLAADQAGRRHPSRG